jgi:hypothetical protein
MIASVAASRLCPYRTDEKPPLTAWDESMKTLKIDLQDGAVDAVAFERGTPDRRTRLSFQRKGGGS